MKLLILSLLVAYAIAIDTNVKISADSLPGVAASSGNGFGFSIGLGGNGNSASSLSVSSDGGASVGIGAGLGQAAQEAAAAAADLSSQGAAAVSAHVHHGFGIFARLHELQHILKENADGWKSEAALEWIKQFGGEFPKVNWTQIVEANGKGFKFSQLHSALRKSQSEAAKQLQALLTAANNDWSSEAVTKWIADNGAKFPFVDWKQVVETSGKDFKIEALFDKLNVKGRFDSIQKLQVILRDNDNNWNSEAVTKWIDEFGGKFKSIDFAKIVAENGKGFTIDSLLGNKVNRFRVHDLHTRLADNEHNWNSDAVKQWVQEFGSAFPDVNWTLAVQSNGNGFNWHQLHTHTHGSNRSPASQLIVILRDNNNDWKAENVTKWIAEFGAKYPNVKWADVVASNGAGFNWDQLFSAHQRLAARLPSFPGFGGFGFGSGVGNGFGGGFGSAAGNGFGGGFGGFPGFGGFSGFPGARAKTQTGTSAETTGTSSAQITTGTQQAWNPFRIPSFGKGSAKVSAEGEASSRKRGLGLFKKTISSTASNGGSASVSGSGATSGSASVSGSGATSGSAEVNVALPAVSGIAASVTNGVSSGVAAVPTVVSGLSSSLTGGLSGLAAASKEISAAFPGLSEASFGIGVRASGDNAARVAANSEAAGSVSSQNSVSLGASL